METNPPKVMISYTHDSPEHKARALHLANRLRSEGINCHIDEYEPFPPEGWPRWMQRNIDEADFVLVVCTEPYLRRFEGKEEPGRGLGGQWEGFMITQDLYEAAANNEKFIPIVFSADDANFIPKPLRGSTHFRLESADGYDRLYRLITQQPLVPKPALGPLRVLSGDTGAQVATQGTADTPVAPAKKESANLTLLFQDESKFAFIRAARIERGADILLDLSPEDAREKAFIGGLSDRFYRPQLAIAFGDTVVEGQVESVTTVLENSGEVWKLKFRPSPDAHYSPLSEFTLNGVTPEDIAELRARRILLNDKPSFPKGRNRLDQSMIESMINRSAGLVKQIESPLPTLYQLAGADKEYFLAAARLMCVLYLKLTGVVEHVFKLDLSFEGEATLRVRFEGERHTRYANVPPHTIAFDGLCELK
jgi:hypothetical protein